MPDQTPDTAQTPNPFLLACERIAQGDTVTEAAASVGVDRSTLYRWSELDDDARTTYARARSISAASYDDEALEVARSLRRKDVTSEEVQAARVLIDKLHWTAGKRRPREYGDLRQVDVAHTVAVLTPGERDARIGTLLAKASIPSPPLPTLPRASEHVEDAIVIGSNDLATSDEGEE